MKLEKAASLLSCSKKKLLESFILDPCKLRAYLS